MSGSRETYEDDNLRFPILQKMSADPSFARTLKPKDLDQLAIEQRLVFERCTIPESQISIGEKEVNEVMVQCIGMIDYELEQMDAITTTAMLNLYRKTVAMPENLDSLLTMTDISVRTGRIRCHAVWHLHKVIKMIRSVWRTKLPSGKNFVLEIIKMCGTVLDPTKDKMAHHARCAKPGTCVCHEICWSIIVRALPICTEPPNVVIDVLREFNWHAILELRGSTALVAASGPGEPAAKTFMEVTVFGILFKWGVSALQKDNESDAAKTFLKELGRSHRFFRRTLERIVSGEIWSKDHGEVNFDNPLEAIAGMMDGMAVGNEQGTPRDSTRVDDMSPFVDAINGYFNCLTCPMPAMHTEGEKVQLDALVHNAFKVLLEAHVSNMVSDHILFAQIEGPDRAQSVLNCANLALEFLRPEGWSKLKAESDGDRLQRFTSLYLGDIGVDKKKGGKEMAKRLKDETYAGVKSSDSRYNMCASCFVLESNLEGNLRKCGGCRQISYCSAKCQKEHWKKVHKLHCTSRKKKDKKKK